MLGRHPDLADFRMNLGMLDLVEGNWPQGWQRYEARLEIAEHRTRHPQAALAPPWDGSPLAADRTLLLWGEQGLGDSLQFVRLLERLPVQGTTVLLHVPEALHAVLADLPSRVPHADLQLVRAGTPLPRIDCQLSLLSLPQRLGLTEATLPPFRPWLSLDPQRQQAWQERLGARQRPRVGLVWSGNPRHTNDRNRSLPLAELLAALPPQLDYHLVQKDLRDEDRALLAQRPELRWHGEALHDFADTAALLANLDHLVTVDTSVAHLAGGLGLPFSLLLASRPDFRWMLGRSDSPWYPTARLYRQCVPRDWAPVLAEAFAELVNRLG